ncbi:bifunctional riboflavin kinase/FMN phosphatase-like [Juglans microcarpa x Juglans regia]|uniref:bifunctional riboflavin kinase/FMN phosphatase-like n=1 Tax=Juglans microcarpa x Juglans regia TaxID=2249226 RepID=UPI001B7F4FD0|nr:bifunctional riboflavin kinase/FMN phosphatase-like [Juglans microcarpa x Juglans regia]
MSCCESCKPKPKILAVILDLDGTLLDTEGTTKGVLEEFLAKYGKQIDREREDKKRLGATQKESAAGIVKDYDLPLTPDQYIKEITPMYREKWQKAKPLPGANRLIKHLHKHGVPFALASNSLREYIDAKISHHRGWKEYFSVILGSDQVQDGKPSPYLFEEAAKRMGVDAAHCLVIEDSLVGVRAANAAKMKVVAVPPHAEAGCSSLADSVLHSLLEFQPELWGLPPFEDWIDNALPIEPIHVSIVSVNGSATEVAEDGTSALPDQVFGLYFGWAKVDMNKSFKVVVSIGWDHCSCIAKRKICTHVIDGNIDHLSDQQIQLLLVGYIRELNGKDVTSMSVEMLEEYNCIAGASLDLPVFVDHSSSCL